MNEKLNWVVLGPLTETETDFSIYSKDIGIYRAIFNEEVVYIGKATELDNGGFRKRLRDYTRSSSSARNYAAGMLMHQHKDEIQIEIIIFKRNKESIPEIERIEAKLIKETQPIWNNQEK